MCSLNFNNGNGKIFVRLDNFTFSRRYSYFVEFNKYEMAIITAYPSKAQPSSQILVELLLNGKCRGHGREPDTVPPLKGTV